MHLVSFLRGMALGGLLVYLFAPRSGAETREMLAQRGNDLKSLISDDMIDLTGEVAKQSPAKVVSGSLYDSAIVSES
ncbi:MAG: YtxH domain-containing protein [Bacteroidota bacterium]|nr:YtxH domain-containing protein [Bacteroidota bacterium]